MAWKQIDFRLLGIAGAILAVAVGAAWVTIVIFRDLFPAIAHQTIWDEISGPTIAAVTIITIKSLLYREKVFHLMVVMDVPGMNTVDLYLLRRRSGWGLLLMPALQREALIDGRDALIRNIFWWGVFGVDRCTFCIKFGDNDTTCRYVELPRALYRAHATIRVRLGELSEAQPLIVSRQHIE